MPEGNTTSSRRRPPADVGATASAAAAQQRLRASSYHALHNVRCELMDGAIVLRGRVSSFYFKQLAQEVVRQADRARVIVNELEVEDWTRSAANGQANSKSYDVRQKSKQTRRPLMDVRILIVDDHPTVRESLRIVFTAAGMERMMEAATCEQAMEVVRDQDVDLVLLDVALRDGYGLDALQEIKAIDDSIPVLIHSYHDNARLLSRGFHLGAAGYVVKGQDKNLLIHAVRQAAAGATVWTAEQRMQIREVEDAEVGELDAATPAVCAEPKQTA